MPIWMCTGMRLQYCLARDSTSLGQVALHMSVYLSGLTAYKILLRSFSNPIS
jgi:hypothetical protein